ncbi:MAG: response regulator transcription factor [Flavobacteriales bacterium]|nr:response regulator transcription factor [Flavobacteriales bacterium]
MEQTPDIIVISDEASIRSELNTLLGALGYDVVVHEAYPSVDEFRDQAQIPDLLILQVGEEQIEAAKGIIQATNAYRKTPIVFITDTKDEVVFSKLKEFKPFGFLPNPLDLGSIRRVVELALLYDTGNGSSEAYLNSTNGTNVTNGHHGNGNGLHIEYPTYFFTKVGNKLRKIPIDEVKYVEVEGKYSSIHLQEKKYNVKASLKELLEKFPPERFVRVSRNFIVNLEFIDHIDTIQYQVKVVDRDIPVSRTYKDELMGRISLL